MSAWDLATAPSDDRGENVHDFRRPTRGRSRRGPVPPLPDEVQVRPLTDDERAERDRQLKLTDEERERAARHLAEIRARFANHPLNGRAS